MSLTEASKSILNFLIQENRPFSINDIVEKSGKHLGKPMVQKALDYLVESNKVREKIVGKHKIYYAKQNTDSLELKKEMQNLTQNLTQASNVLKSKRNEYRVLESQLKDITSLRSIESLQKERDQLLDEIHQMNEKLQRHEIEKMEKQLNPNEAKKIQKYYETLTKAYRKRKRICNDMLDAILEGYPKSKRQLVEDIGVETDEAVGFNATTIIR